MDNDYRRDQYGNIDTSYYLREAHRLRSEYAAEMGRALGLKVKSLFRGKSSKLSVGH